MTIQPPGNLQKLAWSLPWLTRYPFWRAREFVRRGELVAVDRPQHLIFIVANHFEPGWNAECSPVAWPTQLARVVRWCQQAAAIGRLVHDSDGTPFRHTYFFPAEQYHP